MTRAPLCAAHPSAPRVRAGRICARPPFLRGARARPVLPAARRGPGRFYRGSEAAHVCTLPPPLPPPVFFAGCARGPAGSPTPMSSSAVGGAGVVPRGRGSRGAISPDSPRGGGPARARSRPRPPECSAFRAQEFHSIRPPPFFFLPPPEPLPTAAPRRPYPFTTHTYHAPPSSTQYSVCALHILTIPCFLHQSIPTVLIISSQYVLNLLSTTPQPLSYLLSTTFLNNLPTPGIFFPLDISTLCLYTGLVPVLSRSHSCQQNPRFYYYSGFFTYKI